MRKIKTLIKQFFKEHPNACSGRWNFWELQDGSLHSEYQCGNGADLIATWDKQAQKITKWEE